MIDNFSGINTEGGGTLWFLPWKACSDESFSLFKGQGNTS